MPSNKHKFQVVVSESEKAIIEAKAKLEGKSVSSYLKGLALSQTTQEVNYPLTYPLTYPEDLVSQVSQLSLRVSQLEQVTSGLHNLPNPLEAQVNQPSPIVTSPEDTQSPEGAEEPLTLSRSELAQRFAKTPNEAQTYSATLTTLGGSKMKEVTIKGWTRKKDPEGRSWMPTDDTRATWAVSAPFLTQE